MPADLLNQWYVVLPLVAWEAGWKGYGLWKAAKNSQKYWFVAMLLVNSLGILPIVYLKFFQPKSVVAPVPLTPKSPKSLKTKTNQKT